ncbi:ino80 complex subunit d [Plakobranchus ocellatus]|uniref:Ino80 complex subunit d n=1 Tax=Plakobranchus ocellatus TaxID=259542 RepID=A0AAV3ZFN7_9GAST|nr:ino80 complex subunit d [Plakobranchus ocellatus]
MLPKKERKKKERLSVIQDSKLSIAAAGLTKTKFSLSSTKDVNSGLAGLKSPHTPATAAVAADVDDPYAFSDGGPAEGKTPGGGCLNSLTNISTDSILGKSLQSGQGFVRSASDITTSSSCLNMAGGSIIAKFYPELAEKLEKARAKPPAEPKSAIKSRARTSRTMNKLQTKIAQNKINEKLRKSQELNYSLTDSNSSPLQMSSPEQSVSIEHSPSPGGDFSPASTSSQAFSPQAGTTPTPTPQFQQHQHHHSALSGLSSTLAGYEQGHLAMSQDVPPLPQVDTSLLATLAAQDNLGFQSGVGDDAAPNSALGGSDLSSSCSDRLQLPHTPPRLPPPYPGSSTLSTPSSLTSSDTPVVSTVVRQPLLHSISKSAGHAQAGPSGPQSDRNSTVPPFTPPQQSRHKLQSNQVPHSFLSPPSSTQYLSAKNSLYQFPSSAEGVSKLIQTHHLSTLPSSSLSSLPTSSDIFSIFELTQEQADRDSIAGLVKQSRVMQSPNTLAAHMSLPPPPPYVPPSMVSKVTTSNHHLTTSASSSKSKATSSVQSKLSVSVPKMSIPQIKLRKLKGLLSEQSAKRKLKSDLASKYYSHYAKRKKDNHYFIESNLLSSDDESEDEDSDILPWQRNVFSALSEEEEEADEDDDEVGNIIPMGMRPTKISLLKTQLRRQWVQGRRASHVNSEVRQAENQSTLSLIRAARESGACAVRALWQLTHCCLPSFDLRHELPLCQEHAAKADNYQRLLELENKKKPRKKSKPPALTRPPRKGKKKKKGRYSKAQKPMPPPQSIAFDSTLSDVDVTSIDPAKPEDEMEETPSSSSATKLMAINHAITSDTRATQVSSAATVAGSGGTIQPSLGHQEKDSSKHLDHAALELPDSLLPADFDKQFGLQFEQATKLLEEEDLQEVVNKMPFDALDLFGKNGEPDQDPEAGVALASQPVPSGTSVVTSSDLNSAARSKEALDKLLSGTMSEEESMQLAMVLAQSLQSDAELGRHARLLAEAGGVAAEGSLDPVTTGMGPLGAAVDGNIFGACGNVPGVVNVGMEIGEGVLPGIGVAGMVGYGGLDIGNAGGVMAGEMSVANNNGRLVGTGAGDGNFNPSLVVTSGMGQSALMASPVDQSLNSRGSGNSLSSHSISVSATNQSNLVDIGPSKAGMGQSHFVATDQNLQHPVTGPPAYHLSSSFTSSKASSSDSLKTVPTTSHHLQAAHVQHKQLQLQQKQHQQRLQQQVQLQRLQQMQVLQEQQPHVPISLVSTPVVSIATSVSASGSEGSEGVPPILTADLNSVYGGIESLSQFQMAAQKTQTQSLNLNHLTGLDAFTSSASSLSSISPSTTSFKTVIRHLPTDTPSSLVSLAGNSAVAPSISLSSGLNLRTLPLGTGPNNTVGKSFSSKGAISAPPNVCLQQQQSRVAVTSGSQQIQNLPFQSSSVSLALQQSSSQVASNSPATTGLSLDASIPAHSVASAKLAKLNTTQSQLSLQSHALKLQQQQHQLQQLQLRQQLQQQQQQLKTQSATVRYMLQVASSSSSSSSTSSSSSPSPSPLPSSARAKLILPDNAVKTSEMMLRGASPKPAGLPKFSPGAHRLNLNSASYQEGPKQSNFPSRPAQMNDSSRLKLTSSGTKLLDSNINKISLTKSFNATASSASPSPPSFSPLNSSPKPSNIVKLLPGGVSTPPSSSSASSPLMSTTFRTHNLLEGTDSATSELISVTVRQPSPMESVPSTVRHTLPDVCPAPMTLPSTPPLQLPSSLGHQHTLSGTSSSVSLQPPPPSPLSSSPSPSRTVSQDTSVSASPSPTSIKLSGRQKSSSSSPMQHARSHGLAQGIPTQHSFLSTGPQLSAQQNGLQFASTANTGGVGIGTRAAQVVNKFQGNKTNKAKGKGNSVAAAAAEAARLSALASAAGVPVVCNPVSLPGFVSGTGLSTTTFKSSGSS